MKHPTLILTSLLALMTIAACDSSKTVDRTEAPGAEAERPEPKNAGTMGEETTRSIGGQECPPSLLLAQERPSLAATAGKEAGHSCPAPGATPKPAYVIFTRDSPAYREAREHRFKGAVYRGILVEATGP